MTERQDIESRHRSRNFYLDFEGEYSFMIYKELRDVLLQSFIKQISRRFRCLKSPPPISTVGCDCQNDFIGQPRILGELSPMNSCLEISKRFLTVQGFLTIIPFSGSQRPIEIFEIYIYICIYICMYVCIF